MTQSKCGGMCGLTMVFICGIFLSTRGGFPLEVSGEQNFVEKKPKKEIGKIHNSNGYT